MLNNYKVQKENSRELTYSKLIFTSRNLTNTEGPKNENNYIENINQNAMKIKQNEKKIYIKPM